MENLKSEKQKTFTLILLIIYLMALTWLIIFKLQFSITVIDEGRIINLIPLLGSFDVNGVIRLSEIIINIIAFIPLGIYICMIKSPWPFMKKLFTIISLTFVFEIIQYILVIGRADITDIISNTLGGIIGIGIYNLLSMVLKDRTNKFINIIAAIFTFLALLIVALLLINHRWVRII